MVRQLTLTFPCFGVTSAILQGLKRKAAGGVSGGGYSDVKCDSFLCVGRTTDLTGTFDTAASVLTIRKPGINILLPWLITLQ